MKKPLVIGYGNPLRQDDGMGWRAADLLEASLPPGAADVHCEHQLTPELSDAVRAASLVVFLDASVDQPPGCASCKPIQAQAPPAFWHSITAGQLLGLIEDPPPAYLIRGGVRALGWSEQLTAEGEIAAVRMSECARTLLLNRRQAEA